MAGAKAPLASRFIFLGIAPLGCRNPPKPDVGSCSEAEHEFPAIWQPSCTRCSSFCPFELFPLSQPVCNLLRDAGAIELRCRNQVETLEKTRIRPSGETAGAVSTDFFDWRSLSAGSSVLQFPSSINAMLNPVVLLWVSKLTSHFESGVQDKNGPYGYTSALAR